MKRGSLALVAPFLFAIPTVAAARHSYTPPASKTGGEPQRVFVLDGSTVHNVGELQMHLGNWGLFGSLPGAGAAYSEAPSAQWPAGSGTEYLFGAGLWVGALKNGIPAVSTTLGFDPNGIVFEFDPGRDTRDIMYRAAEGTRGGARAPAEADDDGDGAVDEDPLNGYDDDGDGAIDEDFAAISNQMFACRYADYYPETARAFPQHNPLGLEVRQQSFQWEEDRYDDFVGIEFHITNAGSNVLEDVYVGFFADGDAGQRTTDRYYEDDATGRSFVPVECTDLGPVSMDIAYVFDADGDEGRTLGYLGIMFLGHTVDPTGETAPRRVGISTYANFSGSASFEDGGDPTNDFERYELLSSKVIERNAQVPRDYRMLMAAGPFKELLPGSTLVFQTAFVIGERYAGMVANAASAQLTYEGAWFDQDSDDLTGASGRETPVVGPAMGVAIDTCRFAQQPPVNVPRGANRVDQQRLRARGDLPRRLRLHAGGLAQVHDRRGRPGDTHLLAGGDRAAATVASHRRRRARRCRHLLGQLQRGHARRKDAQAGLRGLSCIPGGQLDAADGNIRANRAAVQPVEAAPCHGRGKRAGG